MGLNLSLLRDPGLQTLVAIIGVCLAAYGLLRRRKRLRYKVLSTWTMVAILENERAHFRVTYDGEDVVGVIRVVIRIWNAGTVAIPARDYAKPITVYFGEGARVLEADVLVPGESSPKSDLVEVDGQQVRLPICLLNRGSSMTVSALVAQCGAVSVAAEIEGLNKVMKDDEVGCLGVAVSSVIGYVIELLCLLWAGLQPGLSGPWWEVGATILTGLVVGCALAMGGALGVLWIWESLEL